MKKHLSNASLTIMGIALGAHYGFINGLIVFGIILIVSIVLILLYACIGILFGFIKLDETT